MILPLTPLRFLERAHAIYPEREGVVCGAHRFTYAQFFERCCRLAQALLAMGLQQGERIAFLSYNCHRLLEAYYGVPLAKGVLLPLNIRLAAPEISFILQDADARILFLEAEFLPLVDKIRNQLPGIERIVLLERDGETPPWMAPESYDELLEISQPLPFDFVDLNENSLCELFYTSGTSGDPKGVMLSHRTVYLHGVNVLGSLGISDRSVVLHTIPLFHANGWGNAHTITAAGGVHVMLRKFEPPEVCRLVEAERVTFLSIVPTMATMLVNDPASMQHSFRSLEWVMLGGAAASVELVREVERTIGCKCYCGYGLTETSPVLTVAFLKPSMLACSPEEQLRYQATTGRAVIGAELRVVDEEGCDVPRDGKTTGEIVARGDGIMEGYWRRPQETRAAFRDGWFLTGDMAVWDQEGYLLIVDRKKEIIISGGENISSLEIEKSLAEQPGIYECAVIAVPDEVWGEVPKAFVVLKENCHVSEEEMIAFLKDRLARYKIPRSFEFVPSLPKGGTGKIQKKVLRKQYWAGRDKQVH